MSDNKDNTEGNGKDTPTEPFIHCRPDDNIKDPRFISWLEIVGIAIFLILLAIAVSCIVSH